MQSRMIPTLFPKHEITLSERQKRIFDFLTRNPVGVLTTVDPDGYPHGVVIYFVVDKQFNVSFLTKTGTKKYDNLLRNNTIMLVAYEPVSQSVAQVVGSAHEINNKDAGKQVAQQVFGACLKTSGSGVPPINKLNAGAYTAFFIEPVQIRLAMYERPDHGEYSQIFESLESFELTDQYF